MENQLQIKKKSKNLIAKENLIFVATSRFFPSKKIFLVASRPDVPKLSSRPVDIPIP